MQRKENMTELNNNHMDIFDTTRNQEERKRTGNTR